MILRTFLASLLAFCLIATAQADTLYAVGKTGGLQDQLFTIDPATGMALSSTTVTLDGGSKTVYAINGLAADSSGTLYALVRTSMATDSTQVRELVTIDPDGTATSVGTPDHIFQSLAFAAGDSLYGIVGRKSVSGDGQMYQLSLADAADVAGPIATATGALIPHGGALGYNPVNGDLYFMEQENVAVTGTLFFELLDTSNSFARHAIGTDQTYTLEPFDLTYKGSGVFYASLGTHSAASNDLWMVAIDGTLTHVAPFTGLQDEDLKILGLTLVADTAIPVPAALYLFGSGLIGLIGVARKRNIT